MAAQTCHCSPGDVETVELAWCAQDDPVSIKSNETKHSNNPIRKRKFHLTSAVSERIDRSISVGGLTEKVARLEERSVRLRMNGPAWAGERNQTENRSG